eukprot:TRINITY_DN29397_c0_g2_i1.p1 TRINITY_DN29397_c0_g2~~TRINITY_DN29397_c0_g2_i1.p1  ORF type:complete len:379 (+),score=61.05 TRINITY_DN29397_c0_g2_i1:84-1220(+)
MMPQAFLVGGAPTGADQFRLERLSRHGSTTLIGQREMQSMISSRNDRMGANIAGGNSVMAFVAAISAAAVAGTWRRAGPRRRPTQRTCRHVAIDHRDQAGASRQPAVAPVTLKGPAVVLDVRGVEAESTDQESKRILNGLDIRIREGEVHAVMGPNGSGKSTLSRVLVGDSAYRVVRGSAQLGDQQLFDLDPHERALEGLFLAFQSPPAVNGVTNLDFLRAAYNAQRRRRQEPELDVIEFYGWVTDKLKQINIDPDFLNRNVNEGFSGGERKRNEMLQLCVLEPRLAILDEIDSGLDIDALKDVASTIKQLRALDAKRSFLLVTHFERFLDYVDPDFVHVMYRGRIIKSGGRELARRLDAEGYDWLIREAEDAKRATK